MQNKINSTRKSIQSGDEPLSNRSEKGTLKYSTRKINSKNESCSKIFAAIGNKEKNKTRSENIIKNASNLIGQTLKSKTAIEYKDVFDFNHLGKIIGMNKNARKITGADFKKIQESIIPDLTKTNSSVPREHARTNREIILELIHLASKKIDTLPPEDSKKTQYLKTTIEKSTNLWLSPDIGSAATQGLLSETAKAFRKDFPDLCEVIKNLAAEAAKPKSLMQMHDNTFGRKFESELVLELVKNPPDSVLNAAEKIAAYLTSDFLHRADPSFLSTKLDLLAAAISGDRRPWHSEVPELEAFVNNPSKENFIAMMENKRRTGFEVMKISYIAVRLSVVAAGPWMKYANENYQKAILPARSTTPSVLGNFDNRVPFVASKFITDAGLKNAFSKAGLRVPAFKNKLLSDLNANPTNKNALKIFSRIDTTYKKTSPELSKIAREICDFLKKQDPESLLELVSAELSDEDRIDLANKNISPTTVKTNNFGTFLPHQPVKQINPKWKSEKNIQAGIHVDTRAPTAFEKKVLLNEQNTVNGASGSTNVLAYLYKHMQKDSASNGESSLNIYDAFAGAMMFLTFDGGHSLPESIGTFMSIVNDDDKSSENSGVANNLANFTLDYRKIPSMFTSKDTSKATESAIRNAFSETLKLFSQVHEERRAG